jgi:hypothetical protein
MKRAASRLSTVRYLTLALPVLMFLTFVVFVVNPM